MIKSPLPPRDCPDAADPLRPLPATPLAHRKSIIFPTSFLKRKMNASWTPTCALGTPWTNFQAPIGAPRGVRRGRKTLFYIVKSMILMKTTLTPKITFLLTFGSPATPQGLLWSAKRSPAISQKASLGLPRSLRGFKKRNFTWFFLVFS